MKRVARHAVHRFTREELRYCINIGCRRWDTNRKGRVGDQMYSARRSSVDCSIVGVIGEYALFKLFDMPTTPLENTTFCSHARDRGDAVFEGKKIDVKAPVGLYCRNIQVRADKTFNAPDAYALIVLERPREDARSSLPTQHPPRKVTITEDERIVAHFRGFASRAMMLRPENITSMSYGRFYRLHQSALRTWEDLWKPRDGNSDGDSDPDSPGAVFLFPPSPRTLILERPAKRADGSDDEEEITDAELAKMFR